jgi:SAM-dependent methyltransferase
VSGAENSGLRDALSRLGLWLGVSLPRQNDPPRLAGRSAAAPPVGQVHFGDLYRLVPVSLHFGFDRGTPIDRYYIEGFLARHRADISGRVLEVGDDAYSRRFGGIRVAHQDILHVHRGNPQATLIGDISDPGILPAATFDCMIITQTLHLIYDMRSAVQNMHHALKPDGVLLLTVPGISQIERGEWGKSWYWSLSPVSAQRLFGDVFGADAVDVESYGNVFAATAFLQGIALEEVDAADLDVADAAYPVTIAVRARKTKNA